MPKTLPERIFFTIVMAVIMVYGMIVYNVALNTNGVTNATFVMALHEMPIMVPVAFVLEFFVVEKPATKLAFLFMRPAARREAYEKQAEVEKQQLLADAQKQADEIVAAGKAAVEIERQNKLREADAQATALARSMCEKLLKHNLTAQDDDQLLDDLLQKAGAGNGN